MSTHSTETTETAAAEPPSVKGWCPGALRPMQTGDGLVVRIRPLCGALDAAQMIALADIARRHGNGLIDLTRRANLQLRGIGEHHLPDVWTALSRIGLMDPSADAESVRNVMVSPLAGLDPSQRHDIRPLAAALEKALAETPALWALPGKFGFAVDGGGLLPLDGERADIRLSASTADRPVTIALGIDSSTGTRWLGAFDPSTATAAAIRVAEAFVGTPKPTPRARMRDLDAGGVSMLQRALETTCAPPTAIAPDRPSAADRVGRIDVGGVIVAVGLGAPLGRLTADALAALANAAALTGAGTFRLSPWRALYVPAKTDTEAASLLATGQDLGLVMDARDPLIAIDACPGTPACRSAWADTRAAARQIAAQMPLPGVASLHVSGCAKGCARSRAADLVLVAGPAGFGIVRHGIASAAPGAVIAPTALADLPAVLRTGI